MASRTIMAVTLVTLLIAPAQAVSQTVAPEQGRLHATRAELQELLAKHELSAKSSAYSSQLRARARYEATLIKQRLEQGDFQIGDPISLVVENEPTLSDSLVVAPDLSVTLPTGERIPLKQVLRSEVQGLLQTATAKVVKNPVVRTETFLRIGIMGAVGAQGFYVVKSESLLTDVLMNAGGIAQGADISDIRIERDRKTIWDGEPLHEAITEGRTVDQLSLRAGDMLIVPQQTMTKGGLGGMLRAGLFAIPALFGMIRWLMN